MATRDQEVGVFKVPVGATRGAIISGLNIQFVWLLPVMGIPTACALVTQNLLWGIAVFLPLLWWARQSNADPNALRVRWLWLISGSALADRSNNRSVEIVSASRDAAPWEALLHG